MNNKLSPKKYYSVYTICFIISFAIMLIPFILNNKSFIHYHDALQQYYFSLEYFSDYLQSIIKNLFQTGKLSIPLWDFRIGMGADILTSLNYYVIGDPLNLLCIFFKNEHIEFAFHLILFLRIYLSGVSFSLFSRKLFDKNWYTLAASFIYIFSVYTLYSATMYVAFINPFIYLPLLLLGIEKVLRKESPMILIFSTFISLCSNFYFFYMLVILSVIFFLIRYITEYKNVSSISNKHSRCTNFVFTTFRVFIPAFTGVLLSLFIFLPILICFSNQAREAYSNLNNPFLYSIKEYIQILSSYISPKTLKNYTLLGYCPIVLLSIVLLFRTKNKENTTTQGLKLGFITLTLFLLVPIFSSIMNGFSYSNNRWLFGYSFLLALIFETIFSNLSVYTKIDYLYLAGFSFLYLFLTLFSKYFQEECTLISCIWLFVFLFILFALKWIKINSKLQTIIINLVCICCCTYYGLYYYSSLSGFDMSPLLSVGDTQKIDTTSAAGATSDINDTDFYRVDVPTNTVMNDALVLNYYPTSFYYSLFPRYISQYNKDLGNAQTVCANLSRGNCGRTYINLLSGTKYLITNSNSAPLPYKYVPYNEDKMSSNGLKIYTNPYYLPFAYTYSSSMSYKEYEKLNFAQKEEAMAQCAVVNYSSNLENIPSVTPACHSYALTYSITSENNLTFTGNKINVTDNNASLELEVNIPSNSEIMVYFNNIELNTPTSTSQFNISAKCKDISSYCSTFQSTHKFYWGKKDAVISLGTTISGKQTITLCFDQKGEYEFSDFQIICEDLSHIPDYVSALTEDEFNLDGIYTNQIIGNIQVTSSKILSFQIPYSSGWTAYIDGKEVELININTMWSGVILSPGFHNIELKYCTPGLTWGCRISLITLTILLCYSLLNNWKKHYRYHK